MLVIATKWHQELWNRSPSIDEQSNKQKPPAEAGGHLFEEAHYFCGLLCPPCWPP